jgi:endogenous inhibitor of DNA gyrase (YacG/DUF329 family)
MSERRCEVCGILTGRHPNARVCASFICQAERNQRLKRDHYARNREEILAKGARARAERAAKGPARLCCICGADLSHRAPTAKTCSAECQRAKVRAWRTENKEIVKEWKRRDYIKHRDKYAERQRLYRENNKEAHHRRGKEWAKNNPEKRREYERDYRSRNHEKILTRARERYHSDPKYRERRTEKHRAARQSAALALAIVKHLGIPLPTED